jgi:nitroreductase
VNLEEHFTFLSSYRLTRQFQQKEIPTEVLHQLIACAELSPSDFYLQPTNYVIVKDEKTKEKIYRAANKNPIVKEAGALVVFCGDRKALSNNLDQVLDKLELTEAGQDRLENALRFNFEQGYFGIMWLIKAAIAPILRLFTPMPLFPAVHKRYWLAKQVAMSSGYFIEAAHVAGLGTCPIFSFDEWRVRFALKIPHNNIVPLIVAVGWPLRQDKITPLKERESVLHEERW